MANEDDTKPPENDVTCQRDSLDGTKGTKPRCYRTRIVIGVLCLLHAPPEE